MSTQNSNNSKLNVRLDTITKDNIEQLRLLNNVTLPVHYSDTFYKDIVTAVSYIPYSRLTVDNTKKDNKSTTHDHKDKDSSKKDKNIHSITDPIKHQSYIHQSSLCRYAYVSDTVVGSIACKCEYNNTTSKYKIYIMTYNVLPTYRNNGIGSMLLTYVIDYCKQHTDTIECIYAHTRSSNNETVELYKKHGFTVDDKLIDNYYKRLQSSTAYRVELKIE